jgi:hypothetical protein
LKLLRDADTTREEDTLPSLKFPLAACVAVIVVVPTPTIVTPPPDVTVATAVLLLVYVNAPPLLLVGAVRSNAASPKFLAGAVSAPMVGVIPDIVKGIVPLLLAVAPDADCVNAIVVAPIVFGRMILPHTSAIVVLLLE